MRRTRALLLPIALFALGCGSEDDGEPGVDPACAPFSFSDRGDVRVFVVGHKQTLDDAVSYESYEQSFRRHVESIEPCLSKARPNLVVFPENAALGALLIGSRGAEARSKTSSVDAFTSILVAYNREFDFYSQKFPNASLRRKVLLSVTDTAWRAFEQTFGGIARDFGVWVMSSADVAPAEKSSDPAAIAALADPDLATPSEVWVASGEQTYNSAYLYDPSGARVGRVDKVFLTDPEEIDLELENGSFAAVSALETPFGRIGAATSRDAFYPPFMQRLEDLDVDLVVQPEAFSGWAVGELPVEWHVDVFLSSGWTHQQRYRTFVNSLAPQYTGNFFDLYFDGQVHITERALPGRGLGAYIGQDPIPGFKAIGPWVAPDPGVEDPSLSIDVRRQALKQIGLELLPGSGSPRENAYLDSMVAADLELGREPVTVTRATDKPESRALDAAGGADQRNADVAASASFAIAVWQDARSGGWRIHWATTADGASFAAQGELSPSSELQLRPAVCTAADGRVAVVWQEGRPERVMAAIAPAIGSAFEPAQAVSTAPGPHWEPDCGFLPSGELVVAWSELSSGVAHLTWASRAAAAASFGAPTPVDPSTAAEPRVIGTQIQAALSNDGRALVWLDYREHSWDVYAARWDGTAFTGVQRIDGAPPEDWERLCAEPRVETSGDVVIATWTDLRNRIAHPDIALATSSDGGATWGARQLVPGGPGSVDSRTRGGTAMPRYRPALALDSAGKATLVFQDLAPDKSAISSAVFDGTVLADPARLDDTADAPVSLTRPRVTTLGASRIVVWEDDRDGSFRIYAARLD